MQFKYPFQIDKTGKTAILLDDKAHIEQMVEQVLFTIPGERVNRPTFGTGINQLIFAPLRDEMYSAIQVLIQGALQQWLGDLIVLNSVEVNNQDSMLQVQIQYLIKKTNQIQIVQFSRKV